MTSDNRIAIIGMDCRFPGGVDDAAVTADAEQIAAWMTAPRSPAASGAPPP